MKKMFFVLVMAAMLLSACGSQPAAQEPVEITFTMWGAPEELAVWQAVVDDFQNANPGITVKVDVSDWDSYWTKLNTLIAGGTPPDVFAMDAPLFLDWQSRGALLNLQPYIDANPGFLEDVYPQTLTAYKTTDGYYGLPRDFQTIVLFYNKDMFDAAGVPYPTEDWTYEDLMAAAKSLTVDTDGDGKIDQYGLWSDTWDMELLWSEVIWANGGEIISEDHSKTLIGEGGALDAWKYIDSLYKEGVMPTPTAAGEFGGDLFQAGKAAMTTIGHWAVPGYVQSGINFDVVPMPSGPAGEATSVNSAGFVISKDSKQKDAAFEFVKFALSEAGQKRLAELGFAIPVLKSVAESDAYLKQPGNLNQQVFLDSVVFARMKPVFKGYEEWAGVVGDGLIPVFDGEAELETTLKEVIAAADEVLAANK